MHRAQLPKELSSEQNEEQVVFLLWQVWEGWAAVTPASAAISASEMGVQRAGLYNCSWSLID